MSKNGKVEDHFIGPLEAHFEDEPTPGVRVTLLADLAGHDIETLESAVEWLKRNRQSVKTFPSPKECIKALAAVAGVSKAAALVARAGRVTAENYAKAALAFAGGRNEVPIIKRETPEWDAWRAYWEWLGAKWLLDLTYDRDTWTVPAAMPELFDPSYVAPARNARRYSLGNDAEGEAA